MLSMFVCGSPARIDRHMSAIANTCALYRAVDVPALQWGVVGFLKNPSKTYSQFWSFFLTDISLSLNQEGILFSCFHHFWKLEICYQKQCVYQMTRCKMLSCIMTDTTERCQLRSSRTQGTWLLDRASLALCPSAEWGWCEQILRILGHDGMLFHRQWWLQLSVSQ